MGHSTSNLKIEWKDRMLYEDIMVYKNKQTLAKGTDTGVREADSSFGLSGDGMSTATARLAIDRKVRKKLLEDYDLLELENKGRYYAAKAYTNDRRWLTELLIDKQTGSIQVVNRMDTRRGKGC
jgi:hypothetical protein